MERPRTHQSARRSWGRGWGVGRGSFLIMKGRAVATIRHSGPGKGRVVPTSLEGTGGSAARVHCPSLVGLEHLALNAGRREPASPRAQPRYQASFCRVGAECSGGHRTGPKLLWEETQLSGSGPWWDEVGTAVRRENASIAIARPLLSAVDPEQEPWPRHLPGHPTGPRCRTQKLRRLFSNLQE